MTRKLNANDGRRLRLSTPNFTRKMRSCKFVSNDSSTSSLRLDASEELVLVAVAATAAVEWHADRQGRACRLGELSQLLHNTRLAQYFELIMRDPRRSMASTKKTVRKPQWMRIVRLCNAWVSSWQLVPRVAQWQDAVLQGARFVLEIHESTVPTRRKFKL